MDVVVNKCFPNQISEKKSKDSYPDDYSWVYESFLQSDEDGKEIEYDCNVLRDRGAGCDQAAICVRCKVRYFSVHSQLSVTIYFLITYHWCSERQERWMGRNYRGDFSFSTRPFPTQLPTWRPTFREREPLNDTIRQTSESQNPNPFSIGELSGGQISRTSITSLGFHQQGHTGGPNHRIHPTTSNQRKLTKSNSSMTTEVSL